MIISCTVAACRCDSVTLLIPKANSTDSTYHFLHLSSRADSSRFESQLVHPDALIPHPVKCAGTAASHQGEAAG